MPSSELPKQEILMLLRGTLEVILALIHKIRYKHFLVIMKCVIKLLSFAGWEDCPLLCCMEWS